MILPDIVIILCRPSEPGNVGAVCRAMKNMGLSRLRLAAPAPLDERQVLARAVHAGDIWREARFYDSLEAASGDCSLLIGTTRRRGRRRKNISMEPRALASWLRDAQGRAALVFGNERTGLEDAELDLCNAASHIPVSGDFPSLNLSHAVQIYAYELFLALGQAETAAGVDRPVKGEWVPLTRVQADELTASITATLADLGFYRHPGREEQARFLRDLISRAGLTDREGKYLAGIFAKAGRLSSLLKKPATAQKVCTPPEEFYNTDRG
jgi:tRNA/rRNA methyltransferase/tRNA (cytidine32/uridine32-2'-O)-methyltransferase